MVLGALPEPGRPTIWMKVGQGPSALAVGAEGDSDIFTLIYLYSALSTALWETVRYSPKYCLKGPLSPEQRTTFRVSLNMKICCVLISGNTTQYTRQHTITIWKKNMIKNYPKYNNV